MAERDGYLAADELLDWLKNNYDAATAAADNVLLDSGEPSVMAVVRLVKQFEQRNPALREAAIRRLLPYPERRAAGCVQDFSGGKSGGAAGGVGGVGAMEGSAGGPGPVAS